MVMVDVSGKKEIFREQPLILNVVIMFCAIDLLIISVFAPLSEKTTIESHYNSTCQSWNLEIGIWKLEFGIVSHHVRAP